MYRWASCPRQVSATRNHLCRTLGTYFANLLYLHSHDGVQGTHPCIKDIIIAILNANCMAKRLENTAGIEPEDVPKRLMDYRFHGPTMSWPVPGTRMIEPTESESMAELDALISIREEIAQIEKGKADILNNVLKEAPHLPSLLMGDAWTKPYSPEYAAFPASWLRSSKFWPTTGRVDNEYGDRNLICTLQPEAVEEQAAATA